MLRSVEGAELRGIYGEFSFVGDKPNKQVITKLQYVLYGSDGQVAQASVNQGQGIQINLFSMAIGDAPNENIFSVLFSESDGTHGAFYGDFWTIGNDSGILKYNGDIPY